MSYIDTRDLAEEKGSLEATVLDDFNAKFPRMEVEEFEDIPFEDKEIKEWVDYWLDELATIGVIEMLEDEIGSEFIHGVTLIHEDDFTDYVKEILEDIGYIPRDFPSWIEIDWEETANNVRQDYSEIEYNGETYLFRA